MRKQALMGTGLLTIMLTACGGSSEPEVVEQIVVSEPGEIAPVEAPAGDSSVDLVAAGEAAFAVCGGCHVAESGEASRAGPNLYGVVGRSAGSLDDFAYSDALAGSGITWDAAQLDEFIANPSAAVPGTIMVAGAVADDERRAAIIAYLESLSE
ncbi:c-type cytochrome [Erythrobacter sp. F6033]|uniref:c-type cytochrome n=1 Tax=Erythrobacter sp. F6033 TaxID=2926401 RepID=UPI001FF582F3|nr:c-type cytochrome [Erythrobacter sp. F6033]MCK0127676.1 c-type cytochrome [Erythrobacter sp. F6033]